MNIARRLLVIGFVALLSCAGATYQPYNPKSESVRTIALLTVPNPSQYQVVDWGSKAGLFGAAGSVVIQGGARTMGEAFTAAAKTANFDFGREMQAAVTQR